MCLALLLPCSTTGQQPFGKKGLNTSSRATTTIWQTLKKYGKEKKTTQWCFLKKVLDAGLATARVVIPTVLPPTRTSDERYLISWLFGSWLRSDNYQPCAPPEYCFILWSFPTPFFDLLSDSMPDSRHAKWQDTTTLFRTNTADQLLPVSHYRPCLITCLPVCRSTNSAGRHIITLLLRVQRGEYKSERQSTRVHILRGSAVYSKRKNGLWNRWIGWR